MPELASLGLQRRSYSLGSSIDELGDEIHGLAIPINSRLQGNQLLGRRAGRTADTPNGSLGEGLTAIQLLAAAAQPSRERMGRRGAGGT